MSVLGAWELDANGDFRFAEHADQLRKILADLRVVIQRERTEVEHINKTYPENPKEIGMSIFVACCVASNYGHCLRQEAVVPAAGRFAARNPRQGSGGQGRQRFQCDQAHH